MWSSLTAAVGAFPCAPDPGPAPHHVLQPRHGIEHVTHRIHTNSEASSNPACSFILQGAATEPLLSIGEGKWRRNKRRAWGDCAVFELRDWMGKTAVLIEGRGAQGHSRTGRCTAGVRTNGVVPIQCRPSALICKQTLVPFHVTLRSGDFLRVISSPPYRQLHSLRLPKRMPVFSPTTCTASINGAVYAWAPPSLGSSLTTYGPTTSRGSSFECVPLLLLPMCSLIWLCFLSGWPPQASSANLSFGPW